MGSRIRFETPEDVGLEFESAGPGSRVAAGLIDLAIVHVLIAVVLGGLAAAGTLAVPTRALLEGDVLRHLGGPALAIVIATVLGINLGYFVVAERLTAGQSPGKRLVGLRVVRDGGYGLDLTASLVRNLARIVDALPGPYLVGLVAVLASTRGKRLGDQLAGTTVVRAPRAGPPRDAPLEGQTHSGLPDRRFDFGRQALDGLGDEVLGLLDGYLERREALEAGARAVLEQRLTDQLAVRAGVAAPGETEQGRFLEELYLALRERRRHRG